MTKVRTLIRACKDCGLIESPDVKLSQKGLCPPCGLQRIKDALEQIRNQQGPVYDKWYHRITHFRDGKGRV
jgi:hypothetical protein